MTGGTCAVVCLLAPALLSMVLALATQGVWPAPILCTSCKLRLRHPEGSRMQSVEVNGEEWDRFEADKEMIIIPNPTAPLRVVARY